VSRFARDNVAVAAGTALSRVTGFVRLAALSFALSQSALAGAYSLANNTPNIVYELLLGGVLTASLVPMFVRFNDAHDDATVSTIVSSAVVALLGLTVLAVAAAPVLIELYVLLQQDDTVKQQTRDLAVPLARLFLPQIFFYGCMAIGSALLNARRSFAPAAWTPVINNVVVSMVLVATPVIFDRPVDADATTWLGAGTTAGIVAMTAAMWWYVRRSGIRLAWTPRFSHPEVRALLRRSTWTIGYVAANQIALFFITAMALNAGGLEGVAAYIYAFTFFQLPHGLLAVSLMTTLTPELASAAQRTDWAHFRTRLGAGIRWTIVLVLPASAVLSVMARPLVGLLPLSEDRALAIERTASVLEPMAAGLIGFSLYLFVLRGFYALDDTRTPYYLNVAQNALNLLLAWPFVRAWGLAGLGWAYAGSYLVAAPAALVVLGPRIGGFPVAQILRRCLTPTIACALMTAVLVVVVHPIEVRTWGGSLGLTIAGLAVGGMVYGATLVAALAAGGTGAAQVDR
jgi:putative peptidoglycan lipid II flippase